MRNAWQHDNAAPAPSPWRFSWRAWRQVLARAWRQTCADNIDLMAAGVAFYGFLALVPMLGAIVLCYGLLATPRTVIADVRVLTMVLPHAAAHLIRGELMTIVSGSDGKKGIGLVFALALALFGARSGAGAIITALNLAYEEKETRGFVELNLIALAVTGTAILAALGAIAAATALGGIAEQLPGFPATAAVVIGDGGGCLVMVMMAAAIAAALYRIGPDRAPARWIWLTPGAIAAAIGWLTMTLAFGRYVADLGHYSATYGSLSAVIVVLTWFYLSGFILLFGAELNSGCERQAGLPGPIPADARELGQRLANANASKN